MQNMAGGGSTSSSTATFTQVYAILSAHCSGSSCHNPGSRYDISFSSQSAAYTSLQGLVVAGNPAVSGFYTTVKAGVMPPEGPKLTDAELQTISSWIDAGGLND